MVAQRHRLRGLQMGEAGHDAGGMFLCARHQCQLQSLEPGIGLIDRIPHPQAEIGGHLVIAAACSVQPTCHRPDQLRQPRLGGHVDVFKVPILGHTVAGVFLGDMVQPLADRCCIIRRHDALRAQHGDMRFRRGDILSPQRLVEGNRGIDFTHDRARPLCKPSAPHLIGACIAVIPPGILVLAAHLCLGAVSGRLR